MCQTSFWYNPVIRFGFSHQIYPSLGFVLSCVYSITPHPLCIKHICKHFTVSASCTLLYVCICWMRVHEVQYTLVSFSCHIMCWTVHSVCLHCSSVHLMHVPFCPAVAQESCKVKGFRDSYLQRLCGILQSWQQRLSDIEWLSTVSRKCQHILCIIRLLCHLCCSGSPSILAQ